MRKSFKPNPNRIVVLNVVGPHGHLFGLPMPWHAATRWVESWSHCVNVLNGFTDVPVPDEVEREGPEAVAAHKAEYVVRLHRYQASVSVMFASAPTEEDPKAPFLIHAAWRVGMVAAMFITENKRPPWERGEEWKGDDDEEEGEEGEAGA